MRNIQSPKLLDPGMIQFSGIDTSTLATKSELSTVQTAVNSKVDASALTPINTSISELNSITDVLKNPGAKDTVLTSSGPGQPYTWRRNTGVALDPFVFNKTISVNTLNYNLKQDAIAAGWDQVMPLEANITVASGVYIGSSSTDLPAFDTNSAFPNGSLLTLVNNGYILGKGGLGGRADNYGSLPGYYGGPGFRSQYTITVTNNGTIGGGGGGGGGGAGGAPGASGYVGGTGAGCSSTSGGSLNGENTYGANGGAPGVDGTIGGHLYSYGGPGTTGGGGGGLGASGGQGGPHYNGANPNEVITGSSGGSGGPAVVGMSNIIWNVTGTRYGALNV